MYESNAAPAAEPIVQRTRRWALGYLADLLNVPSGTIDLARRLTEHGLDSVDAVVMAAELEDHLGLPIDPMLFLRDGTLEQLIDGLTVDEDLAQPPARSAGT